MDGDKNPGFEDFTSLITISAHTGKDRLTIAGTLLARNNPRVVLIDQMEP